MQKQNTSLPEIKLVGILTRTNKTTEADHATSNIFLTVKKYFHERLFERMKNQQKAGTTYCVYTDYEDNLDGEYTYFIGEEVSSFDSVPEGMSALLIPAQRYAQFTSDPGDMPAVRDNAWSYIHHLSPQELGGKRQFIADFEIYDERAADHQNIVFDIFVGVK